jgi:hypothetical protein
LPRFIRQKTRTYVIIDIPVCINREKSETNLSSNKRGVYGVSQ